MKKTNEKILSILLSDLIESDFKEIFKRLKDYDVLIAGKMACSLQEAKENIDENFHTILDLMQAERNLEYILCNLKDFRANPKDFLKVLLEEMDNLNSRVEYCIWTIDFYTLLSQKGLWG